ncbi:ABC transporter substrate-binding protein [Streptomyces sp. NPDC102282]|uniref:ABC transporter substrate-binding protein n=1 Tax=Streptomyces sp. NPDC102282 TaxID=3366154 RepID=UPI00382C93CC
MLLKRGTRSRPVSMLVAAALTVLSLTGCAVGRETGADRLSRDRVTIRLNWWGAEERQKLTADAVRLFEKKHPRIHVQMEYSDWTGYWDRLATMSAAGDPPDVIQMDALYLSAYADRGALLDLGKSKFLDRGRLPAKLLDTGRYEGKLYAVPNAVTAPGLAVNTTLLDKLGLKLPDTKSWTWSEYEAFAAKVNRVSGGKVAGALPLTGASALELFARQRGDRLFSNDGHIVLRPETLTAFWDEADRLIKSKATLSRSQLADAAVLPLDQSPLATGKTATSVIFASQLAAYAAASGGDEFILVDLPSGAKGEPAAESGQFIKPAMYWSISAQTQHPAESALLVNFLTGDKQTARILGAERGLPAVPAVRAQVADSLSSEDRRAAEFVESIENKAKGPALAIAPTGANDVEASLTRYGQEVMFGRVNAKDAARAFIKEMADKIYSAG